MIVATLLIAEPGDKLGEFLVEAKRCLVPGRKLISFNSVTLEVEEDSTLNTLRDEYERLLKEKFG